MIRGLAVVLFALSAFFIFYTVRLLVVTGGLAHAAWWARRLHRRDRVSGAGYWVCVGR